MQTGARHGRSTSTRWKDARTTDWLAKGVVKYHGTMGTTLNLLIRIGFVLDHVEEWAPTESQVTARPEMAEELERPMFLLIAARRTKDGGA